MSDFSALGKPDLSQSPFEKIKRFDDEGNEYWSARELMPLLGYGKWIFFKNVLNKARIACENSGQDVEDHMLQALLMVTIGSDAKREIPDVHLSRYACYLVVQNADPSKPAVALGQTYFTVQTRRQEIADERLSAQELEDQKRLHNRRKIKHQNVELAAAAKKAGVVTSHDFATFQNFGYRGLYNGLTAEDIHRRKRLKKSQQILDHMSSLELAANLFRSAQAEDKLRNQNVRGKDKANQLHYEAGVVVRQAMKDFGNTMPEDLPTVESIKILERREKKRLAASKTDEESQS
jgi:DNA-damage-inducible protein D